jgi:hypothetical protein
MKASACRLPLPSGCDIFLTVFSKPLVNLMLRRMMRLDFHAAQIPTIQGG